MIYKGDYKPSELLCPVHFKWVDFEMAKKRIEAESPVRHCCALYEDESSDSVAKDEGLIEEMILDIGDGEIYGDMNLLSVSMLSKEGRRLIDPIVAEFANEVGPELARKIIVKLS